MGKCIIDHRHSPQITDWTLQKTSIWDFFFKHLSDKWVARNDWEKCHFCLQYFHRWPGPKPRETSVDFHKHGIRPQIQRILLLTANNSWFGCPEGSQNGPAAMKANFSIKPLCYSHYWIIDCDRAASWEALWGIKGLLAVSGKSNKQATQRPKPRWE